MMKAAVGSRLAVTGRSSATVSAGPMPGSTPIAVPMVTPRADQSRFIGVSATGKPAPSAARVSIVGLQALRLMQKRLKDRPDRKVEAEAVVEADEDEGGQNKTDQDA